MGTIVPAGFAELAFRHVLAGRGDEMVCTIGIEVTGAMSDSDWGDLADTWGVEIVDATMRSSITFLGMQVRLPAGVLGTFGTPTVGGGVAAIMPPNNAILVNKHTGLGGRKNRGRFYLPSVPEGSVDESGVIEAVHLAGLQLAIDDWQTAVAAIADVGFLFVLHSDALDAPTEITSLTVNPIIATQRQRLRD